MSENVLFRVLKIVYKRWVAPSLGNTFRFKLTYLSKHGYWPDLENPRSMMEKITWLLRNDRNPLRAKVADRILAREFVAQHAPECKLPANLWIGTEFTQDVWDALPQKFVIKGNHGSQMTRLVDKAKDGHEAVRLATRAWLDIDYSQLHQEWVYAKAQRVLVVEEMLELDAASPPDWKFMCGNGRVLLIAVDLARFSQPTRNIYNREFVRLRNARIDTAQGPDIAKPASFDKAVRLAEQLTAPFDFIRADLYIVGDDIYFGEMTNFPSAAMDALEPKALDFEIGSQITLDGLSHQTLTGFNDFCETAQHTSQMH
ncbi:MAG: ATP-grasp fold amidoligase family protein [Pseudomonadota bacterium]